MEVFIYPLLLLFYFLQVLHSSLSDKFPAISRTLLSILIDVSNAVVWMVSTHLLMSSLLHLLRIFLTIVGWWAFTRVLSDRKSSQVSRTRLSILIYGSNAVLFGWSWLVLRYLSLYYTLASFSHYRWLMGFHWSLSNKPLSLQDSSQYSGSSQQYYSFNGLNTYSNFQLLQSL